MTQGGRHSAIPADEQEMVGDGRNCEFLIPPQDAGINVVL